MEKCSSLIFIIGTTLYIMLIVANYYVTRLPHSYSKHYFTYERTRMWLASYVASYMLCVLCLGAVITQFHAYNANNQKMMSVQY